MSHWQKYHARWSKIHPPLRPNEEVVQTFQSLVDRNSLHVLLLGVTPELADAFEHIHAIDKNPAMIANVWPGDTPTKKAIEADWLTIDLPQKSFDAVIGDGSLNNVSYPTEASHLLERALHQLKPGGVFACRLFERPQLPFTEKHLQRVSAEPAHINVHAFKWQVAMHLAERDGANVPVQSILHFINTLCPDRDHLAATTGWPRAEIDTIDIYEGSAIVYAFPNRKEFETAVPSHAQKLAFVECGTYDLAACCPIMTFQAPH